MTQIPPSTIAHTSLGPNSAPAWAAVTIEPISRNPPTLVTMPRAISKIFFMALFGEQNPTVVAGKKAAAGDERDPHRVEEPRRHGSQGRFDGVLLGSRLAHVVGPRAAEHVVVAGADRLDAREAAEPVEATLSR